MVLCNRLRPRPSGAARVSTHAFLESSSFGSGSLASLPQLSTQVAAGLGGCWAWTWLGWPRRRLGGLRPAHFRVTGASNEVLTQSPSWTLPIFVLMFPPCIRRFRAHPSNLGDAFEVPMQQSDERADRETEKWTWGVTQRLEQPIPASVPTGLVATHERRRKHRQPASIGANCRRNSCRAR